MLQKGNSKKNVQTLQCLIDNYNGKDIKTIINQKNNYGWTPLDYAYESINPLSKMRLFHCCVNMVEKPIDMIKMEIK